MQKEENKANATIVKYFVRTLSMYDSNQICIDQKVAYDRFVRAKQMYVKVLKPLDMTRELSRLEIIQLSSFMPFTPHEEYIEVTSEALMLTNKSQDSIRVFTAMAKRAIHVQDKIASAKCIEKASELCVETFKELGKHSRQFWEVTRAGIQMIALAEDSSKEILTLAQENLLLAQKLYGEENNKAVLTSKIAVAIAQIARSDSRSAGENNLSET